MKINNEHISLISQDNGMSYQVESLQPANLPTSLVHKKILAFLEENKILEGVQHENLLNLLENANDSDQWKGATIATMSKARLDWLNEKVFTEEPSAHQAIGAMERLSKDWTRGKSPSPPHFFLQDEVIATAQRPSSTNCQGEASPSWDPVLWLEAGQGLKWVAKGEEWQLISKTLGYLVIENQELSILSPVMISQEEMDRSLLILPPCNNQEAWEEIVKTEAEKYQKKTDLATGWLKLESGQEPTPPQEGSIDQILPSPGSWHQEVEADDVLAIITPHQQPSPGLTVTGQIVPTQHKELPPIEIPLGEGVNKETLENGKIIFKARNNGVALMRDGILSVHASLDHPGDLEPQHGPIRYGGLVVIGGDVLSGSVIECDRLVVRGTVENQTHLIATASVEIEGGVMGEETEIKAPHIKVRLVQGASLEASELIEVLQYAYGASLLSLGDVIVKGESLPKDHNSVVGGTCSALGNLSLHSVGSTMASTLLGAGIDLPLWESCEKAKILSRQLHRDIQEIQRSLPIDLLRQEGLQALKEEDKAKMEETLKAMKAKIKRRAALLEKLQENRQSCINPNGGTISIQQALEPDVSTMIGEAQGLHQISLKGPIQFQGLQDQVKIKVCS